MTSRELVYATLEFRSNGERVPRHMWTLPWATSRYPGTMAEMAERFPDDIVGAPNILKEPLKEIGDMYAVGQYVDPFGVTFENLQYGVIGEVKDPLIKDDEWADADKVRFPVEYLTLDTEAVNAFCRSTDKFVNMGVAVRPFERLQFLRGTENLFMDLADPCDEFLAFVEKLHKFYCEIVTIWARDTQIDAVTFMDDWGTQNSLLINPKTWVEIFKPMYKDYIDIAHKYGKKAFMHSDGNTLAIYPHLIELGLDAFNSQIFCIGVENLRQYAGKITFWGELDRQWILPTWTAEEVAGAVDQVYDTLWRNGGCIAQCEFGPGAKPENVIRCFERWNEK